MTNYNCHIHKSTHLKTTVSRTRPIKEPMKFFYNLNCHSSFFHFIVIVCQMVFSKWLLYSKYLFFPLCSPSNQLLFFPVWVFFMLHFHHDSSSILSDNNFFSYCFFKTNVSDSFLFLSQFFYFGVFCHVYFFTSNCYFLSGMSLHQNYYYVLFFQ